MLTLIDVEMLFAAGHNSDDIFVGGRREQHPGRRLGGRPAAGRRRARRAVGGRLGQRLQTAAEGGAFDGRDTLEGGEGADILVGIAGSDRLVGGRASDRFVFVASDVGGQRRAQWT